MLPHTPAELDPPLSLTPVFLTHSSDMSATIEIAVYRGSWNCPNTFRWTLIIAEHGFHGPDNTLYNLINDGKAVRVFRTLELTCGAKPLGVVHISPSTQAPNVIVNIVQGLSTIINLNSLDWVVQAVMHMTAVNVANAALDEGHLTLHLRNLARQWAERPQVSFQHAFLNDHLLGSAESMNSPSRRNVTPMKGKARSEREWR